MTATLPESQMFFIVGRGRSGTTLLSTILNRSPTLRVAPESLFIMNLYRKYRRCHWYESDIFAFYKDLWLEGRMIDWCLNHDGLLDWLLRFGTGTDFATVCRIVYARHAKDAGIITPALLGDKNPHYSLFAGQLMQIFPRAKFIYMIRDYRDNIASYRKVSFDSNNNAALAYRWLHYNQSLGELAARNKDRFLTVRYEDLAVDPSRHVAEICAFIGAPFSATMLEQSKVDSRSDVSWHRNLGEPVSAERVNRWEESLTPRQVADAELICGPYAQKYEYTASAEHRFGISAKGQLGLSWGWFLTRLELLLFRFPLGARALIIKIYRIITGTHTLRGERRH